MIELLTAGVIVVLFVAGAVAGDRRRRRAGSGYISQRDLLKYK